MVVQAAGGPEAAARSARYDALAEAADRLDAAAVLLGHTRDDQAETVLLRLARGSGTRSLSGMAPVAGRYLRPLLDVDRATTRQAALAEGLDVWDDPHNVDPSYARVRVREQALPMLSDDARAGDTGGAGPDRAAAPATTRTRSTSGRSGPPRTLPTRTAATTWPCSPCYPPPCGAACCATQPLPRGPRQARWPPSTSMRPTRW